MLNLTLTLGLNITPNLTLILQTNDFGDDSQKISHSKNKTLICAVDN